MKSENADACITNSQAGKRYLIEILKAEENRVFAHPYEVPAVESLSEQTTEVTSHLAQLKHPVFLFVGGIIPRKGLHLLLEACAILQEQGCDRYTLLIVGDGTQREELETFTQEKGLGDRIQWIGKVSRSKSSSFDARVGCRGWGLGKIFQVF